MTTIAVIHVDVKDVILNGELVLSILNGVRKVRHNDTVAINALPCRFFYSLAGCSEIIGEKSIVIMIHKNNALVRILYHWAIILRDLHYACV